MDRGTTTWELNSPSPVSQPSAQASSSNAAPGQNQPKTYPQPQPRSQLQAKSQSQTQDTTQAKANNSLEDSSEHSEGTLKITTPFKRTVWRFTLT